jgi:CRISPR system Cascade subunit CasA
MPAFNLVDQPWLPCVTTDSQSVELSLREALLQAHELRELYDPSPLVTVALHRLLLALLHRTYNGPEGIEEWSAIWNSGRFATDQLDRYLDNWRHRFDLFDDECPFYQVPFIVELAEPKQWSPISRLAQEAAAGNNATLFDHRVDAAPRAISAAEAARSAVAMQAFAVGGGVSKPFNFGHGPITRGFTLLALGDTLFQTLALNLLPYNQDSPIPRDNRPDLPAWEWDERPTPRQAGSTPAGYLDYLTWQSRQIHLFPRPDSTVEWCQFRQQMKLPPEAPIDPFKSYIVDPKTGRSARSFRRERALWRDSAALLEQTQAYPSGASSRWPGLVEWLAQLTEGREEGLIGDLPHVRLAALGLSTEQGKAASVILWRREELPLPLALLADRDAISNLAEALSVTELVGRLLSQTAKRLAELLLVPMSQEGDGRKADPAQAKELARALALEQRFWPRLDAPFAALITALPEDQEQDDSAVSAWAGAVRAAAIDAFEETADSLDRSGRALKAVAAERGRFFGTLYKTLAPLMPLRDDEEVEGGRAA